jgi:hypothetical protein
MRRILSAALAGGEAAVQWWDKPRGGNLGDQLSPLIVERVLGVGTRLVDAGPRLLAIGSVLGLADRQTVVWGSGFVSGGDAPTGRRPPVVLAVRGPRTARRLVELGSPSPEVLGDPGLLAPLLLEPSAASDRPDTTGHGGITTSVRPTKDRVGLILHIDHLTSAEELGQLPDVDVVIDFRVRGAEQITEVLRTIRSCSRIISSGLHGLVLAHAFGIPAAWVEFTSPGYRPLNGGRFKFHDHLESVGSAVETPNVIEDPRAIRPDLLHYTLPERDAVMHLVEDLTRALSDAVRNLP